MGEYDVKAAIEAARAQAELVNFLDFTCLFEADSFDDELEDGTKWQGLVQGDDGEMLVYAEMVYNGEVNEDGEKMGMGWYI